MKKFITGLCLAAVFLPPLPSQTGKEFSLQRILEIGVRNNPRMAALHEKIEADKAAWRDARAYANPRLSYQRGHAENYEGVISRATQGLSLNQAVENPFKRHYRIKAAESGWRASEFHFEEAWLELVYEIKKQFYTILWLEQEEKLAVKNFESIREIYELTAKKAELGEVRELEALKLEVESMQAENEISRIRTELKASRENLNAFLGHALPREFILAGELSYTPVKTRLNLLLETALGNHPKIKKKKKEEEQARHQVSLSRWRRLPDFELSAFTADELHGQNQGLGISLNIPLWNWESGEIARRERLLDSQRRELNALEINLTAELRNRHARLILAEKTLNLFQEGLLKQARESERIARFSYQHGETSLLDYLDSQRTFLQIQKDYYRALFTWALEKAGLEKAVGEDVE